MNTSTWICTKEKSIVQEDLKLNLRKSSMGELKI
jgi:betaine lipid synthase